MSTPTEDRLRRALAARAEQVTPSAMRVATPLPGSHRRAWWWATAAAGAVALAVVVAGQFASGGPSDTFVPPATRHTTSVPDVVASGQCPNGVGVALTAVEGAAGRADIDGDGVPDTVALGRDSSAAPQCSWFVVVQTAGDTVYSAPFDRSALPPHGFPPRIVAFPMLGHDAGAEVVVDTRAGADATVAQLFTFAGGKLVHVADPTSRDGNLILDGGGVNYPRATGCTADGLLTEISAASTGRATFAVTESRLVLSGERLREVRHHVTRHVPGKQLVARFPALRGYDFGPCTGRSGG
ncbi:MAG: hypothetical protein QOE01_824 [Actinomycetota bacterium]|jgi:hypothetical protein|nr:hypothetical protein [Actinomycetota bacterium]